MKTRFILIAIISLIFFVKCIAHTNCQTTDTIPRKKYIDTLVIEGENIWIRSEPKTGDVILKLNTDSKCYVLEKGEKQTIRENTDFWYKIDYLGKEGWVFGSQTSLKQLENENFEDFFSRFISDLIDAEYKAVDLKQYISPIHGTDYTCFIYTSESIPDMEKKKAHYTRENDKSKLWTLLYFDYKIWQLSDLKGEELKNRIEINKTNAVLEIPKGIRKSLKRGININFHLLEGKWYMRTVSEYK